MTSNTTANGKHNVQKDSIIWSDETTLYIATPTVDSKEHLDVLDSQWESRALADSSRPATAAWEQSADLRNNARAQALQRLTVPGATAESQSNRESWYKRWSWRNSAATRESSIYVPRQHDPLPVPPPEWRRTLKSSWQDRQLARQKSAKSATSQWTGYEFSLGGSLKTSLSLRDPRDREEYQDGWPLPDEQAELLVETELSDSSSVYSAPTEGIHITLWDGTIMTEDSRSGVWSFRPRSDHTIELLQHYAPLLEEADKCDSDVNSLPLDSDQASSTSHLQNFSSLPVAPAKPTMSKTREWLFVANVCLAQFFSLAALAQSFAPLFILGDFFGTRDVGDISWYTAAYSMTLGTFILPAGRLGDMFGHKRIFVTGWLWFSFWSMITGFSWFAGSSVMFSACRGLQGIGPALLVPNAIALIGRTFPPGPERALAISIFGGMGPTGVVTGAIFSSLFAQLVWWPWSFWTLAIACLFAAILSIFVIPTDRNKHEKHQDTSFKSAMRGFDILGATSGVASLLLINFALNQAPLVGWQEPYIPALLVVGILLLGVFVWVELRVAAHPIVPLKGLTKDAAFTLVCIACGWASHGIWSYYLFLLLEGFRGYSPLRACAHYWPVAPVGFCAALSVSFLLRKLRVAYIMSMAMLCFVLCIVPLAVSSAHQSFWSSVLPSVIIAPFAMNFSFPAGTILMSNAVPREHQGIAASLVSTAVNYSLATGLGIAGSIDRYVTPAHGVLAGFRGAWYFGMGIAGLGLLVSLHFIWQTTKSRR